METKQRETVFKKGYRGQEARTAFELPDLPVSALQRRRNENGIMILEVATHKTERGALLSYMSVSCEVREDGAVLHTFEIFGDYSRRAIESPGVRCTEKSVAAQHARALEMVPALLQEVEMFYAQKRAKEARDYPIQVPA